jgi:pyruvate carboxylase subunit B
VVEQGQGVVIIEAMKMENELKAESAGVVSRVHVSAGEPVEKDQILVDLEARPAEEE